MTPLTRCSLDRSAIEAIQLEKLQLLLTTVVSRNPFYSAKLQRAGVSAAIASLAEFVAAVPFTDNVGDSRRSGEVPAHSDPTCHIRWNVTLDFTRPAVPPVLRSAGWILRRAGSGWSTVGLGSINLPTPFRKTGYSFHFRLGLSWDSGWRSMLQLGWGVYPFPAATCGAQRDCEPFSISE